jgi:hypothetical protein
VLLADDHRLVAEGLKRFLASEFELADHSRMAAAHRPLVGLPARRTCERSLFQPPIGEARTVAVGAG